MTLKTTEHFTEETMEEFVLPAGELILAHVRDIFGSEVEIEFALKGKLFKQKALTTVALNNDAKGRQAVVSFVNGDIKRPIVMGLVHSALNELLESFEVAAIESSSAQEHSNTTPNVSNASTASDSTAETPLKVDGKPMVFEAQEELQLRCGDASITLTKDGKILIRGKYLLNRASGINRIVGGSVQVN